MSFLLGIIQAIIGLGFSIIALLFKVVLAVVAGVTALFKHRSPWLWGIGTFIFPWLIFIILFMPKKYPKLPSHLREEEAFKDKNPVIASIMALAAIVAKSDGAITREEVSYIKTFVSRHFGIVGEELNSYAAAFDYGKNHPEAYRDFTGIIIEFYNRRDIMISIAYLLVAVGMQDGNLSDKEDAQIRSILLELGLSEYEYSSIKNSFNRQQSYYSYTGAQDFASNNESQIKKSCEVLGVSEDASMAEIKKAYRKLVKEYHPDKLASESMPEDYIKFANEKIRQINEAYEYLQKVKGA